MMTGERCGECSAGVMEWFQGPGRKIAYRKGEVDIPETMSLLTCSVCAEFWIDWTAAKALDNLAREAGLI